MIKRNSPNRQLKLSLVWLLAGIAMIPIQGFCISTIWNWFMPHYRLAHSHMATSVLPAFRRQGTLWQ